MASLKMVYRGPKDLGQASNNKRQLFMVTCVSTWTVIFISIHIGR
jgi:hypothetical protein